MSRVFEVNVSKNTPTILVDRDKFQQVMMNLIENAAKYSFDNTKISVVGSSSDNYEYVSIKVSNVGVKLAEEDYDKIFTKFSRIDNPLTRKVQGSGLGLYNTKNIVDKMKGSISVVSSEIDDKSAVTTFEVKFPVCNVETQAREKCKQ